jgi:hypothetical protein
LDRRVTANCTGKLQTRPLIRESAPLHKKKTPLSESASELYRPSDRRLSAKLVPTFTDRVYHVVSVTDQYGRILGFLDLAPLHEDYKFPTVIKICHGPQSLADTKTVWPTDRRLQNSLNLNKIYWQTTDPTSRQRGRPTETRQ